MLHNMFLGYKIGQKKVKKRVKIIKKAKYLKFFFLMYSKL